MQHLGFDSGDRTPADPRILPYAEGGRDALAAFRAIAELAPIGLARFALDGRFTFVNRRFGAMLGRTPRELETLTFQEVSFPDDAAQCIALNAQLLSGDAPSYTLDKRFTHAGGRPVWTRVTVTLVRDAEGAPAYFLGAAEDASPQHDLEAARRDAEQRLHLALEASSTGTFRWDMNADAIDCDEHLRRILGLSGGERTLTMSEALTLVAPEHRRTLLEACWESVAEGTDFEQEIRIDLPDGGSRWLRATGRVYPDGEGRPAFLTGACADVTVRRRAVEQLRTSEEQFRMLADAIPQLAWMAEPDGWIFWYNQRWYEYTGTTPEQVQGWGWQRVHHPDHVQRVTERIRHCFEVGAEWEDTFPLRGRDGGYRWFLSRAVPLRDGDGRIVRWFGTNTDVTPQLDIEGQLRDRESRLRRIVDSGIVGVYYWNADRDIVEANDAFLDLLGYTRDDIAARRLNSARLTPERWQELDRQQIDAVLDRGAVRPWEKEFIAADGRAVPVLVAHARLDDGLVHGVGICLDISRAKAEAAERERLLTTERAARVEAERATRVRDDVLAIVAHDLRSPLHTLLLAATAIADLPLSEADRQRQSAVVRRTAASMDRLINDLLDIARIESGALAIHRETIAVAPLLDELCDRYAQHAARSAVSLACDATSAELTVPGDRDRLLQALGNLLGNAVKFTPPGGSVRLRTAQEEGMLRISVSDSGGGIPAADLPRIFDRFWQAAPTSRLGAGLGLPICRGIVEAHGGRVWAESIAGAGATFHVALPLAPPADQLSA